ncbi:MAG: glycosyltransferase family 4 protein [Pseudomonadota bacterium]
MSAVLVFASLLIAFVTVLAGVAAYLPLAQRKGWGDRPNHRSSHEKLTPSSGGVVIVLAMVLAMVIAATAGTLEWSLRLQSLIAGMIMLCVVGAWDDRHALGAAPRLLVFFLAATPIVLLFSPWSGAMQWAVSAVLLVALVWVLNLYNFMDGVDGIAALQCVIVSAVLGGLGFLQGASNDFVLVAGILSAAYAGFLFFNWPPARIFMGDAGSLPAGLMLGALGLWQWSEGVLPAAIWLVLMSPFLLDTAFTLIRRALRGERITHGHREHIYQRLYRHWGGATPVNLGLLVLQLGYLCPLAVLGVHRPEFQWTILTAALFPQLVLMAKFYRLT